MQTGETLRLKHKDCQIDHVTLWGSLADASLLQNPWYSRMLLDSCMYRPASFSQIANPQSTKER